MKKNSHKFYLSFLLLLILFLPVTMFAQLSGTKTIGGATPDYATIKDAIKALNTQGVTSPGVTFLIRGGTYAEDSLRIRTSTSSASAPIIFKPDVGATVVINVSPPNTTYNFAIKIDTTQYVTIDGSNNGTTTRDLTINSIGVNGQRGIWVSGASHYATIKNCNVNAGKDIASPTTSVRCIDFLYTGVGQDPDNILCENNFLRYAYFGVRMEGNAAADVMENAIVRNNVVDSVANTGIYSHYQNNSLIYNNDVNVRRGSSAVMYGIYVGTISSNVKVYSNKVYDLNQLSTTSVTYGIYNGASSTTGINSIYNNFVRAINLPATGTGAMYGIYSGTGNTTTPDVFAFNTVYLTGASTGNRITAAFYKGSATGPANVNNNIFHNTRTDGTTGVALAIYKTSTATVLTSNNNNLYVGTPDVQHYTGRISTTNYATLADWRTANSSDLLSFAENSPFISSTDLHIQTSVPTQLESGGIPIAGITNDIDGDVRNASTPDIGGDEFAGIALDLTPPIISFTPLPPTSSTSARTLTSSITDLGSGVPTAGIGLPVLYWRINSGSWNSATAVYQSGNDYQFTFGSGVVLGDTVRYYIVAQDNATPPNVIAAPSNGAGGYTANPPAAATPPTNPNSYLIVGLPLSGSYTVGVALFSSITGKDITFEKSVNRVRKEIVAETEAIKGVESTDASIIVNGTKQLVEIEEISWIPMENGQIYEGDLFVKKAENTELDFPEGIDGVYLTLTAALNDLNNRGVDGATTFLLTDATYPTETYPLSVNVQNVNIPTSTNTVTIKPNTGVNASISGASSASQILRILNSYVTIDGSNSGGTSRDLTIENTSATTPQVIVIGSKGTTPITNVTVKNCVIINGVNSSTPLIVSDGNTPGTAGWFNNITIQNNSIQKGYIGNYNIAVVSPGNGSGLDILFNDFSTQGTNSVRFTGIYVQGVDGAAIADNHIANFDGTSSEDDRGIWLATGTVNTVIERNLIHSLKYTGTGGYGAHGITISSGTSNTNNEIINNVIFDISGDAWGTSILGDNPHGIYLFSTQTGIKVFYNSIYLYGNTLNRANAISTGITLGTGTTADIKDNVIVNNLGALTTLGLASIGIYVQSASTQLEASNYNDIWIDPTGTISKYIGQIATTGYATLLEWQTATTQDANSISSDPQFIGLTDLRPSDTSPLLNAGTPIAGITTDILGATRNATTPTIGAYEMPVFTPLAGDYTVGLSMFNQFSGLNLTFEKRVRTIEVTETIVNPEAEEQIGIYEETTEGTVTIQEPADETALTPVTITRTEEQEYFVPMLNGYEYKGSLYYEFTPEQIITNKFESRGVYATITEAVNDAILKGVSAAVRFLLVDATYPSETFPIVINAIPGASAVNTISILPNTGVTSLISGTPANNQIFDFNGVDYFIIDGRAGGVGTNIDLTIENLATTGTASHTIRLINGATNNVLKYVRINNYTQGTAGPRAVDFNTSASDPAGNSFNRVESCYISGGRTGVGFAGTLANPNSDNVIIGNKMTDFSFAGVWLSSNAANTTIDDNEFFQTTPVVTSGTGISLSTSGIINIRGNKFYDLQNSTATTLRGISGAPSAGGTVNIVNNFFSFTQDNGTKTSIYAIQISGTTEHTVNIHYNTFNFAGVHTGGTAGVLVSAGLVKSNTGATSVFNAKNNIGKNTRTGGTTGVIHTNFFVGTTAIVGTLDINYNAWYAFGDPGSFHAGWGATVYNDLTAYKAATTPHEQQTIFKDVNFVSGVDLHLAGLSVGDADLAGLPLAGITDDIDGDVRDLTYPYRGADESAVKFLPISTPSNLVVIPDTLTAELSWQDNSNNEAGFIIQRKDGDSTSVNPFETIDTVATNVIYYLNSGLNPNTTYTWRVFAYNVLGVSSYSNMATATTFIPVELTAFNAELSGREILVSWATATELNNRGFDIERKMNGEWEKLGFKEGRGTTTTESSYSFIDKLTYESFVGTITYRLKQMDFDGTYAYSPEVEVEVDLTPKEYTLYQNYPNPFNPVTTIKYSLPFESNVRLVVYNILGEMLDVLVDETKQVGFHDFNWNASNLASGIYIYTIEAKSVAGDKNYSSVKKMILMK